MENKDRPWYRKLKKSSLTPPSYTFGIVWPILYVLLIYYFISMVLHSKCQGLCPPLIPFLLQMVLNVFWSPTFFRWKQPKLAFVMILGMITLTGYTMYLTYFINPKLVIILIPYLLWISFASYLNGYIVMNN